MLPGVRKTHIFEKRVRHLKKSLERRAKNCAGSVKRKTGTEKEKELKGRKL